jgi:hypothetical protein
VTCTHPSGIGVMRTRSSKPEIVGTPITSGEYGDEGVEEVVPLRGSVSDDGTATPINELRPGAATTLSLADESILTGIPATASVCAAESCVSA